MGRILIIDDDAVFLDLFEEYVHKNFPNLEIVTCSDPLHCLTIITTDLDLLLVDLEMPGIDGTKVLAYATSKGMNKNRIVILSGREAEYLHEKFPMGSCLAVLNKHEARQKEVLDMVFNSIQKKSKTANNLC